MKPRHVMGLLLVVVGAGAVYFATARSGGVPGFFDRSQTYQGALEKSRATGRPVFALFSADWCGPCHEFEGGALADRRVVDWLTANTIPVFLDITNQSSPGAAPASQLGVMGIPAIVLMRDGRVVGKHEGVMDAGSLMNWLETFSKEPVTPAG